MALGDVTRTAPGESRGPFRARSYRPAMAKSPTPPRRLEYVPVDDLPDHPRNPRDHDLAELIASVRRFGFTSPPMIDGRTGLLAEGHGRKRATIALQEAGEQPPEGIVVEDGRWYVPVVSGWSSADDSEADAYLLAGNQGGGWHTDPLATLLAELAESDQGLTGTGFDQAAADLVFAELAINQPDADGQDPDTEWDGMPEFGNTDRSSKFRIVVHFKSEADRKAFVALIGNPPVQRNTCWWPESDGLLGYDGSRHYVGDVETSA